MKSLTRLGGDAEKSEVTARHSRRRLLGSLGGLAAVTLAGCSEEGAVSNETANASENDSDESNESDGMVDSEGVDGTDEMDESTGAGDSDGMDGTDGTEESDREDNSDVESYDGIPRMWDAYTFEGTMEHPEDPTVAVDGQGMGDDFYMKFDHPEQTTELYSIGDTMYTVARGQCVKIPPDFGEGLDLEQYEMDQFETTDFQMENHDIESEGFWADKTPTGTDSLNGVEVERYQYSQDTMSGTQTSTVYVRRDTGYIYRVVQEIPQEGVTTKATYQQWSDPSGITAPEMQCMELNF